MKATAVTGISPDRLRVRDFEAARGAIIAAYVNRGMPSSGRNMSAIFTRLRLTLFHCGQLSAPKRRSTKPPVTVSGWSEVPEQFADTARRYIAQAELSLRPNTVNHIDHALRAQDQDRRTRSPRAYVREKRAHAGEWNLIASARPQGQPCRVKPNLRRSRA